MMPRRNGIEVMQELKKKEPASYAKYIIFLTNIDDTREINEISRLSDGYFLKTQLTPNLLALKVKDYLASKK
jgi:DNA-binding NarL/FixJ family response regulator